MQKATEEEEEKLCLHRGRNEKAQWIADERFIHEKKKTNGILAML